MKAPNNYIFITVDSEFNDEYVTKDGTKILLSTQRFGADDEDTNANYRPTMLRKNYGTVVGNPGTLTDSEWIFQINPGEPAPRRYVPSEVIMIQFRNDAYAHLDKQATLYTYHNQYKYCSDLEMEVQDGDKIYFHHNTVVPQNLVSYLGQKIYRLPYHHSICIIRENKVFPVAGHVLIQPLWEDGVEDLGNGQKGKMTASGIVTELHDKPKYLEGIVRHVCSPLKGEEMEIQSGDKIIYVPNADYEVEIEGEKYYVMKYWDVLGKTEEPEEELEIPSPSGFIQNI